MSTDPYIVASVRTILEARARDGRTITFSDLEKRLGTPVSGWKAILDPISQDCRSQGEPDLTCIVVYAATGYPPFLNDGIGDKRAQPFNPNNLKQIEQWQAAVTKLFDWWKTKAP
jgi:hypothetical protein